MRVGALLRFAWLLVLVPVARCGGVISGGSDGGDAGGDTLAHACSTTADCSSGLVCMFLINQACPATGQCLPPVQGKCSSQLACGCDGLDTSVGCAPPGYTPVRIQHFGPCDGCSTGLACELCDVSGYSPTTMSKPVEMPGACTPQEISDFTTACFASTATQQTCQAWQTKEADAGACVGCLFTLQSSAAWGPLVCTSASCSLNYAGCTDLVLGQVSQEKAKGGSGSCGDLVSASYGCTDYACSTCDTTGTAGTTDFDTCAQSAAANECKSYVDVISSPNGPCAILEGDAAPPAAMSCFPQSTTEVPNFLNVFCGTGP